jgi:DNA-binding GntR family transcriptional regulator
MAKKEHALQRDSMAERVKQELLRRIMNGELPPGTRLIELHIARELNTSQGPVREALCELEGLELVVTEPYKGSRVREVTQTDIREAYMVRAALEELAGQLAAPHFENGAAALRKTATSILEAARRKDIAGYARHDIQFHRTIVEGASNRILLRTWNSLAFEVRIQLWLAKGKVDLLVAQEAHWAIIDALEAGDGRHAGELLRKHIFHLPSPVQIKPAEPLASAPPTVRQGDKVQKAHRVLS